MVFRREGLSPSLSLLMSTFAFRYSRIPHGVSLHCLRNAPHPYTPKLYKPQLRCMASAPVHFRRKTLFRPVSCYASLNDAASKPNILVVFGILTFSFPISHDLGTLAEVRGCCPFTRTLAPAVCLPTSTPRYSSLLRISKTVSPIAHPVLYPEGNSVTHYLNSFRGEPLFRV